MGVAVRYSKHSAKRRKVRNRNVALEQLESLLLLSTTVNGLPATPDYYGGTPNWAYSPQPTVDANGNLTGGIEKFVDSLPGLTSASANDLGQYLPVAIPDQFSYPGSDYYEIAVIQYTEQMNKDLAPTTLRGYVQIETSVNATFTDASGNPVSKHIPLFYPDGNPIRDHNGNQVYAFDKPSYLGPELIAQRNVPVRVKFDNYLPTGEDGNLFLPVDTTVMGSGAGPIQSMPTGQDGISLNGRYMTISLMDPLTNTSVGEYAELSGFTPIGVQRPLPHHRHEQRPEAGHR